MPSTGEHQLPVSIVLGRRTKPLSFKAGKKGFSESFKDQSFASDTLRLPPVTGFFNRPGDFSGKIFPRRGAIVSEMSAQQVRALFDTCSLLLGPTGNLPVY